MAKRKRWDGSLQLQPKKRSKIDHALNFKPTSSTTLPSPNLHPLLNRCYPEVKTLKQYILNQLPLTSRVRKKQLGSFEREASELCGFLNSTLVGLSQKTSSCVRSARQQQLNQFTQVQRSAQSRSAITQHCSLDEVIEFVIWCLFNDKTCQQKKSRHILCHGLERSVSNTMSHLNQYELTLPGIFRKYPNAAIDALRRPFWQRLLDLCGADGEAIFVDLLLDCGVFVNTELESGNYYQVTGYPLHDFCLSNKPLMNENRRVNAFSSALVNPNITIRKMSEVTLVRNRMFYGRPSLNCNNQVCFGLKRSHILNRESDLHNEAQDYIVMQYIFPRHFKLHNVFTSITDRRETSQPFKDYTFRDELAIGSSGPPKSHILKRMDGRVLHLVRKLRCNHHKCSFDQLIAHYCPLRNGSSTLSVRSSIGMKQPHSEPQSSLYTFQTQIVQRQMDVVESTGMGLKRGVDDADVSFLPYATSDDQVSSFCRAALAKLLPGHIFGVGSEGKENFCRVMKHIDKFVRMRKFETTSLHELKQGLKLKAIEWLAPKTSSSGARLAKTDKRKRDELLDEVLYYVFDSILIPLIAANFYVTESSLHRNRLLYFRHDVWIRLCKPCLLSARLGALLPVSSNQARSGIAGVQFGYNSTRLVPKDIGTRAITNLKRRPVQLLHGKRILAPSVNSRLTPVFNIFNYERQHDDGIFKSDSISLQSLGERLAAYRNRISSLKTVPLYFVKVDIRSAFDSIPQQRLLDLTAKLFKHKQYLATKHAVSKVIGDNQTSVKFIRSAQPMQAAATPTPLREMNTKTRKHTICSNVDQYQVVTRSYAQTILRNHVQANIVRVGNKYYKQTEGIPQGSILSSLLCTFFYNHFEQSKLNFLDPDRTLLLRIIDDFLLITTEKAQAAQFVKEMGKGHSEYGILIHAEKSLVNFDIAVNGIQVPKSTDSTSFPFCGLLIDTESLSVGKDRCRKDNVIKNSLTVDLHGRAGGKFKRRLLSSLRIQLQGILLNTGLNSMTRVLRTLVECFQETAMKLHQYYVQMTRMKRPGPQLIINTIVHCIDLAFHTIKQQPPCRTINLARRQIMYLAAVGISRVLSARPASYSQVIAWLHDVKDRTEHSLNMDSKEVVSIFNASSQAVQHYIY